MLGGFAIKARGLDEAIALLAGMKNGGVHAAMKVACGAPAGSNAAKWKRKLGSTAKATVTAYLNTSAGMDLRPFRASLEEVVQQVTDEWHDTHAAYSIEAPLDLIAQAMALGKSLYTNTESGQERVRQKKKAATVTKQMTEDEQQLVANVRQVVRQWVIEEKRYDERDADVNFDPEAITDRLMYVLGLKSAYGDPRHRWAQYLDDAQMKLDAERLGQTIADFMARRAGVDHDKIVFDRVKQTGNPEVTEQWFKDPRSVPPELHEGFGLVGDTVQGVIPSRRMADLLALISTAWVQDVVDELPRQVSVALTRAYKKKDGELFTAQAMGA